MKPIELLKELLHSQKQEGIASGDWDALEYRERLDSNGEGIIISIPSVSVGFSFDKEGNFNGIYNYQD